MEETNIINIDDEIIEREIILKQIVEETSTTYDEELKNDECIDLEKNDWGEILEKVKSSGFIIDEENFEQVQKIVRQEYYQKHMDIMITRSLMYYEKNKEKVLEKNNQRYREVYRHKRLQEKYNKANEKYKKSLNECKCGKVKQTLLMFCDSCIVEKFGENVVF